MRVLVVSEGRHELALDRETGPLVELLRRLMTSEAEFVRKKVSDPAVRTHKQKGKAAAYEKRALMWISYAAKQGFDSLVLLVDQDGETERREGIDNAQQHPRFTVPRALGLAVETFDAWMLADEQSLSVALGRQVPRQKSPEGIRNPKDVCRDLHTSSNCENDLTQVYTLVAASMNFETVTKRCPLGFAPFRSRVEELNVS